MKCVTITDEEKDALCHLTNFSSVEPPNYKALCEGLVAKDLAKRRITRFVDGDPDHVGYLPTSSGSVRARELCTKEGS